MYARKAELGLPFYRAVECFIKDMVIAGEIKGSMIFNDMTIDIHVGSRIEDICYVYDLKCQVQQLERRNR